MRANPVFTGLKRIVFPKAVKVRKILLGLYRNIRMPIDFSCQSQLYFGLWEAETSRWLKKLSVGIHTAIDIGAASGEQTLFFITKTNADLIYAFEPSGEEVKRMKENIALNPIKTGTDLRVIQKYVGKSPDNDQITLDTILASLGFPCFIKMDIDGGEVDALLGSRNILHSSEDIRWLIETHSFELERKCVRMLAEAGYTVKIIRNAWWRFMIPEQRPIEMNRWLVAYKDMYIQGK